MLVHLGIKAKAAPTDKKGQATNTHPVPEPALNDYFKRKMRQEARELTKVMREVNPGSFMGYYDDMPRLHINRANGEIFWDGKLIGILRIEEISEAHVEFDSRLLEGNTARIEEIMERLRCGGDSLSASFDATYNKTTVANATSTSSNLML